MKILNFIKQVLLDIYWKFQSKRKGKYKIGKYEFEVPPDYALPNYQRKIKLYDRFLPILAKHLTPHKLIIDVGANIGDTAIAIIQECDNPIICIEPSDIFFSYLEKNIKTLEAQDISRILTINKFVGTGYLLGELKHNFWGTASIDIASEKNISTPIPLDLLIKDNSNVLLLKVDTDGFDFDVIKSAKNIISKSEPIIYWENQIFEDLQLKGYDELYSILTKQGYKYIFIFDNFGNLISEESDFETLKNINAYLYSQEKHGCTRTFNYTDILASTEKNYILVTEAINEYKREWINK